MSMLIDHLGIAVADLNKAVKQYCNHFGYSLQLEEDIPDQKVKAAFLNLAENTIELLQPASEESPLYNFIKKRGGGLHHICYRVSDIAAELKRLKECGYLVIDNEPRPGSRNTLIAFIHPKSSGGVLIELCQKL